MTTFEFDGEKYKQSSAHQKEWGAKIIESLKLNGNEHILDLGCGDGVVSANLARHVPNGRVLGVDASESMIKTAQKLAGGNLSFQLMDINKLAFQPEFHVVFSSATLHWLKDHKKLLNNAYRALIVGGFIRFQFAGDGNCRHFNNAVKEVMDYSQFKQYFTAFTWPWYMPRTEEYRALLEKSNFEQIKVWDDNADRAFPDADSITKWIDQPSLVPFLVCVDKKDKQAFRDAVVERVLKFTHRPDGTHYEVFRRINVQAYK